ncbi:MAG: hypothetical protein WC423_14010, partial [Vulcanimicrobiota bacterium]
MNLSDFLKLKCTGCGAGLEIVKFPACRCTHCGEAKEFFLPELMMSAPTVREQNLGISESRAVHLGRLILRGLQEERPQLKWIPFWVLNGDLSVVFRTSVVKRALFGDTNSIKETVVDRPNQRVCIAATSTRACGHLAFRAKRRTFFSSWSGIFCGIVDLFEENFA